MQIKRLQESKNEAAFNKALDTIPATLEDTYRDILERLSSDDREAARTILIWLSFSLVPMDLKTVADVVSFNFPDDVIQTCTTSLVTVRISDDTVRLAHFSVKEFFVCNEAQISWYQFSVSIGHLAIVNKAIDTLLETKEVLTKTTAEQKPLLFYSARYWDRHLAELGEAFVNDKNLQQKIYVIFTERDIYLNWMRLASFGPSSIWRQSFEELPPPLYSASERGLEATVERLLSESTNPDMMVESRSWSHNALLVAANEGQLDILELLLKTVKEIPQVVLQDMMFCIKITETTKEKLPKMLSLLWDKGCLHDETRGSEKRIDQDLVELAARNFRESGNLMIRHFLDQKKKFGFRITEKLLKRIMENDFRDEQLVELLWDKCDIDLKLTPTRMKSLAVSIGRIGGVSFLNRWLNDIEIDEEFIEVIARGKIEAMELLLEKRGEEVLITQKVLITATRQADDPQMVSLLLKRRAAGTTINKDVILAASQRLSKGSKVMRILLDECGSDTTIDDEILQEIVRNRYEGLDIMKLLLSRQQAGFVVTEETFSNAARCNNQEMMELLVNNASGSELPITDQTLVAVADNPLHGGVLMKYLFDLKGHDLPVSEDSLVSIAKVESETSEEVLTFILERWAKFPTTDKLLEATSRHLRALKLLLDRRQDCLPIRSMVQKILEERLINGGGVFELLLDRQLVEVDEWLIETAAENADVLEVIYNRNPQFAVTPKIVATAARDANSMRILLDRQKDRTLITEDVIKAALEGRNSSHVISLLLTRLGPRQLPITEDILIFAVQKQGIESLRLFLEKYRDLNLTVVWQAIWHDPGVDTPTLARAARVLFQYTTFEVSEDMLLRFPAMFREEPDYGFEFPFDDFVRSCMRHRISLPTTESAIELVIGRSSLDTIDIVLEDHPDIHLTEKHIEAGKNNPRDDMDQDSLMSLLHSRMNYS